MTDLPIPFNNPTTANAEYRYLEQVLGSQNWSGDGPFTQRCQNHLLKALTPSLVKSVLLTHSCTAALELCALLCELHSMDEVIMSSWTMTSTANAVVLRGARPIFVDVDPVTLNINPDLVEAAITKRTKAIFVTHYAGVVCDMDRLVEIAAKNHLYLIEDAAQAYLSFYKGMPAGSFGHAAALSFHATKNIISGEGGAFVTTLNRFAERAEIIREKGTNRSKMLRGEVDKYSWVDVGSSYLPSELIAAVLYAQLEYEDDITSHRHMIWNYYNHVLSANLPPGVRLCNVPKDCITNGHIYFLVLEDEVKDVSERRDRIMANLRVKGIQTSAHYRPLHNSYMGMAVCSVGSRDHTSLPITERAADGIIRLPMRISTKDADRVIDALIAALGSQ